MVSVFKCAPSKTYEMNEYFYVTIIYIAISQELESHRDIGIGIGILFAFHKSNSKYNK